jgi:hypothetical protein
MIVFPPPAYPLFQHRLNLMMHRVDTISPCVCFKAAGQSAGLLVLAVRRERQKLSHPEAGVAHHQYYICLWHNANSLLDLFKFKVRKAILGHLFFFGESDKLSITLSMISFWRA